MSIFAALGVVAPAEAAVDYFLEVNGVPGESHDSKFAKSIDVQSYTWGASANNEKKGNKVNLSDLNVSKNVDVGVPALLLPGRARHVDPALGLVWWRRRRGRERLVRLCGGVAAVTPQDAKGSGGPSVFAGWNATTGDLIATYPDPCGL